mmetsp:Transcript_16707/g.39176  ORF Transcript_16707/g.39176 Transcript_16707/m.39176 type:complete len:175 (+) Transcript_16707:144-668(+)
MIAAMEAAPASEVQLCASLRDRDKLLGSTSTEGPSARSEKALVDDGGKGLSFDGKAAAVSAAALPASLEARWVAEVDTDRAGNLSTTLGRPGAASRGALEDLASPTAPSSPTSVAKFSARGEARGEPHFGRPGAAARGALEDLVWPMEPSSPTSVVVFSAGREEPHLPSRRPKL